MAFLRPTFRFLLKFFLLSLPLTLAPLLIGSFAGFLLVYDRTTGITSGVEELTWEMESDAWQSYWNVPGAPTIFDVNTGPFYDAVKLRTADWMDKMDLTKDADGLDLEAGVDRMATIDGLLWPRAVGRPADSSSPRGTTSKLMSKWVYLSDLAMPAISEWDAAFDQLLQYHAAHLPADDAELFYAQCVTSAFLCRIWNVQHPTLVHFSVDGDAEPVDPDGRRPVTVKVVHLPLDGWVPAPGAFPTPFEQLRVVTSGTLDLEPLDEYDAFQQELLRLDRHVDDLRRRYAGTLGRIINFEDWMKRRLPWAKVGISIAWASSFFVSLGVGILAASAYDGVVALVAWYQGVPGSAGVPDPYLESLEAEQLLQAGRDRGGGPGMGYRSGENFMADMFRAFMEEHADMIGEALQDASDEVMDGFGTHVEDPLLGDTIRDTFAAMREHGRAKAKKDPSEEKMVTTAM
ncbi:hypothetical protein F4778DRAFT_761370 [Xylariomycetidae sp. FL2044]|nr:hypothetical protein F4778DRAFT_761370 [Xylariomycetidae sp. FL2044]